MSEQHRIPPIVDAQWVAAHSHDVLIVDVRWYLDGSSGREAYLHNHIPGAIWIDLDTALSGQASDEHGRHPIPDATDFATELGEAGIGDTGTVVAYDDNGGAYAARLVWLLRLIGQNAAVLDGGLQSWPAELVPGPEVREATERTVIEWPKDAFRSADEVSSAVATRRAVVLDARAPDRYSGEVVLPSDIRSGHIPGARNAPWADNLTDAGTFLPPAQLREQFTARGATAEEDVIVYCGSGVTACHNLLALESIGVRATLYPGSWSAWSADSRREVVVGSTPGASPTDKMKESRV